MLILRIKSQTAYSHSGRVCHYLTSIYCPQFWDSCSEHSRKESDWGRVKHAKTIRVTGSEPSKNQGKGILECEGVGRTVSCSFPGSCRSQWVTPFHTMTHNLMPHPQSKTTCDYRVIRFCNCSSIINCNFYLLLDSYLDVGGAGVSSQLRQEYSSAG